ncbi:protein ACCELERATED CELL DEATH 6-like isoform X3 [Papaver somniferum]|uniref:protein ACCELERATED CELL DEATH 6-like isoform X3 n=1 Tax=Papaver somniferum TaxID=3469 RepID=UPI000E6FD769|nr:protein ACCELERATED CELL DEATH 6-like isoform X3 [Papaver somniferum]
MYSVWEFGENHDDDHHQCHQDILISKLVKSQEAMFNKLIKSQEDMFDKLVKSQKEFYKLLKHNNKNNDGDDDDETSDEASADDEEDDDIQDEVSDQDDQQLSDHIESAEYEGGEMMCTETTLEGYEHLFEAAKSGDWKDARESFQKNPEAMSMITNEEWKTAQRIAVLHNQLLSLKEIVKLMPPEAIEYQTRERASTALHAAAMYGYTEAAKVLVNKNPRLTQIRDTKGRVPLQVAVQAVTVGQTETVNYLYSVTRHVKPSPFLGHDGARLLCGAIDANFYDIALSLVKRFPKLVTEKSHEHGICGLESITQRPFAFLSGAKLTWWQRKIYSLRHIKQYIYKQKLMHKQALALVSEMFGQIDKAVMDKSQIVEYFSENSNIIKTSIKHGTKEVVVECLKKFPFLIWHELGGQTMIQMAIAERNEKIFNVICETSGKDKIDLISRKDKKGYTLLHYAAKIAPAVHLNSICGTALQVQRELQWFKGVESIIPEDDRVRRNRKGYTAQFIFTQQHKGLVEKGGEWMKDTSGSCMVVAALIATVAFAAVFTVPGGNISDSSSPKNGTPIFLQNTSFMVFATADALALFSSITSVLMFLAIYTSRHAEEDFYKSLPQKLIIGLATLFISMATILVAFGASLFIVLGDRFVWSLIPIALFSCIPLSLFASLQLPLFAEMVRSTYWNCLFGEHRYIQPIKQSNEKMEGI